MPFSLRPLRTPTRSSELIDCGLAAAGSEPLFHHVAVAAGGLCDAPGASMLLFDDSAVYQKAAFGSLVGRVESPHLLSMSGVAFRSVVLSRVITDADAPGATECLGPDRLDELLGNFRGFLSARIMSPAGLPMGCLCVCDPRKRRYGPSKVKAITALADHCSAILARLQSSTRAHLEREESEALLDLARIAIWSADVETQTVRGTSASYRRYGLRVQRGESIPRELFQPLIHPEDFEALTSAATEAVRNRIPYELQFRITDGTGGWRWQLLRGTPRYDLPGAAPRLLGVLVDIDEQKCAELDRLEAEERMRVTLNSIGDAVISTDQAGRVTFMNPVAEVMTGWSSNEAEGRMIEDVMDLRDAGAKRVASNPIRWALRHHRRVGMAPDCRLVSRMGVEFHVEDSAAPIRDGNGNAYGAVIVFRDVSEARAMATRLSHLAHHDALTDLPNRVLLADRLGLALTHAKRRAERVALLFLDLDGFKQINDTAGHTAGDELLRQVSRRLVQTVRADDTVSRQGGDEFIVLMPYVGTAEYASRLCQRILDAVSEPYYLEASGPSTGIKTTISVGVAIYPEDGDSPEILLRRADAAMYLAKQSGRNQYRFFASEIDEGIFARHALLSEMRRALDRNEFSLEYQPKFAADSRRVVGLEALLRWRQEGGVSIWPSQFIPLAEDSGLIVPIGDFVVRSVCKQARSWRDQGLRDLPISINISPVQLLDPSFLTTIESSCLQERVSPAALMLEITEKSLVANDTLSGKALSGVHDLGMRISLDDFGTGFSSLGHLQNFPWDEIKVDRSLIAGCSANGADVAMVAAICNMGKTLKLNVVAKGVETEEQARTLASVGCNELQGFYLSPSLSPKDVRRHLAASPEEWSGTAEGRDRDPSADPGLPG